MIFINFIKCCLTFYILVAEKLLSDFCTIYISRKIIVSFDSKYCRMMVINYTITQHICALVKEIILSDYGLLVSP